MALHMMIGCSDAVGEKCRYKNDSFGLCGYDTIEAATSSAWIAHPANGLGISQDGNVCFNHSRIGNIGECSALGTVIRIECFPSASRIVLSQTVRLVMHALVQST